MNVTNFVSEGYEFKELGSYLEHKLAKSIETKSLIDVSFVRGIGKSYSLVKFAKDNNYGVISWGMSKNDLNYKNCFGYIGTWHNDGFKYLKEIQEDRKLDGFIIDETIDKNSFDDMIRNGINIVGGYVSQNAYFEDSVKYNLINEIKMLTPKIKATRESNDIGTYKNLIQAYRDVLCLYDNRNH